jgi:hypothetical protein
MSAQQPGSKPRPSGPPDRQLLTSLERLYGQRTVKTDIFGRRIALPSEVAACLAASRSSGRE